MCPRIDEGEFEEKHPLPAWVHKFIAAHPARLTQNKTGNIAEHFVYTPGYEFAICNSENTATGTAVHARGTGAGFSPNPLAPPDDGTGDFWLHKLLLLGVNLSVNLRLP